MESAAALLYKEKYKSLNLDKLENDKMRKEALDKFALEYLLLPDAWKMRIQCEKNLSYSKKKNLIKTALSDFYSEEFFDSLDSKTKEIFEREENPFDRCLKWRYVKSTESKITPELLGTAESEKILIDALSFSHSKLGHMFDLYKRYSGKFVSNKFTHQLRGYKDLYEKIEADEKNLTKWCEWIIQTKNNRFIIQNFECRIAKNPFEIELWKIYMEFLITVNKKAAFDVYHRYRRLFIDDNSINEIFGNLKVEETLSNVNYLEQMKFQRPCLKRRIGKPYSKLNLNVYQKLPKQQNFSFRANFLNYLMKTASKNLIYRFHQSCRQLFLLKNIPLCHSIFIGNKYKIKYFKDSIYGNEMIINRLPEVCLEQNLIVENCYNFEILPVIIPKIKSCNLAYLKISNQNFSTTEYEILTESKQIRFINFSLVSIRDKNGCPITLQDLLKNLLDAYLIIVPVKISITSETAAFLSEMRLNQSHGVINILISKNSLNFPSTEFVQFSTGNQTRKNSVIHISCASDVDDEQVQDICLSFRNARNDWKLRHPHNQSLIRLYICKTV